MVIDYTTTRKRKGLHGKGLVACPKCGRKSEPTTYKDGSAMYTHKGTIVSVAGIAMFHVDDCCFVSGKFLKKVDAATQLRKKCSGKRY